MCGRTPHEGSIEMETESIVQQILSHARYGYRVVIDGKVVWSGLGNRAGLHSFAGVVIAEKWGKSGGNFAKKISSLPAGTQVELHDYYNKTRDRGTWKVQRTVTI